MDTRKELFDQLWCFHHIFCRHRLGPRHLHLVLASTYYPPAANQYPQEVSRLWNLLDGLLVSTSPKGAHLASISGPWLTYQHSCVVATAVRLYFGHQLSLAGSGKPVTDEEFSSKHTQSASLSFLQYTLH